MPVVPGYVNDRLKVVRFQPERIETQDFWSLYVTKVNQIPSPEFKAAVASNS